MTSFAAAPRLLSACRLRLAVCRPRAASSVGSPTPPHPLLDFSTLPDAAVGHDALLIDATWFATGLGRGAVGGPPLAERLASCIRALRAAARPASLVLAAFDAGSARGGGVAGLAARLGRDGVACVVASQRGGASADDILASACAMLATRVHPPPLRVLVASGDADMRSLLRSPALGDALTVDWLRCAVFNTSAHPKRLSVETAERFVAATRGVPPRFFPLLSALAGRPGDNAPGVSGIGHGTAASLVRAFVGEHVTMPHEAATSQPCSPESVLAAILDAAAEGKLAKKWGVAVNAALASDGAPDVARAGLAAATRNERAITPESILPGLARLMGGNGEAGR